jgi:putative tryptophan/tyrosine transport system substrate-binding protein
LGVTNGTILDPKCDIVFIPDVVLGVGEAMRRREFIALVGRTAVAWPFAARAQGSARLPTIGFLGAATPVAWKQWVAAFVQRLHELNWIEGRTVTITYRWAEGREQRYAEIAAEFVHLKVDVIVTSGAAVAATKQVTSVVPIVFGVANDPLTTGLVASLARPGGNVTGLSLLAPDLAGKRIEILREVFPALRRLAVMGNINYPASVLEISKVQATAGAFGLETIKLEIQRAEDIAPGIDGLNGRADGLYVCADPLLLANAPRINDLAIAARLPTINGLREMVKARGLISYGPNIPDLWRRSADYVDKILHGAKIADLPVEQPTKFELVVNLQTAKALGLTIPESFLSRADEVIE